MNKELIYFKIFLDIAKIENNIIKVIEKNSKNLTPKQIDYLVKIYNNLCHFKTDIEKLMIKESKKGGT